MRSYRGGRATHQDLGAGTVQLGYKVSRSLARGSRLYRERLSYVYVGGDREDANREGAGANKKWAGVVTTWNFARVGGKMQKYEPVYVCRKNKETPDIIAFNYSLLNLGTYCFS